MLENAHGPNAMRGGALAGKSSPCLYLTVKVATMTARNLFEKTQNAAEGKRPSGEEGVGLNFVVMMVSCTGVEWGRVVERG